MTFELLFGNNLDFYIEKDADLVYCDFVYENLDFLWATKYWKQLKDGGIFITQCDWHSCAEIWMHMKSLGAKTLSHSAWRCEWGNHPSRTFHQCFDDILIFTNNEKKYKFYPEKIQVPKATITKGLNPSGRKTKQATAWIDDCVITTTAKERIKKKDGHLVRWQKPIKLFDRIVAPFVDTNDFILDPFMGVASLGAWAKINGCQYVGIENDLEIFDLAKERIEKL